MTEFPAVTLAAFGYLVVDGFYWLATPSSCSVLKSFNREVYFRLVYELGAFGAIAASLRVRGWQLKKFNLQVSWALTGAGALLARATYGLYIGLLFAYVYWRWSRLRPLIFARGVMDFLRLLAYR